MVIMITGGAGYLGSVLTNMALQRKHSVKAVDCLWFDHSIPLIHLNNPDYQFYRSDISDAALFPEYLKGVDFIIHTAAVVGEPASNKFPELTRRINDEASKRLFNAAREYGVEGVIFLSTCSNYGVSDGVATEDTPLKPLSIYAETKVSVEKYLMAREQDIDWVICRLSTLYGSSPRMRFDLTVNDFTMNAFKKKYLDVFLPYTYRPYVHVYDVANILLKVIENFQSVKNNVFNVGFNGENYQKIAIAKIIKEFIPEIKIEVVEKGTDLRDYQVDFSKLKQYLSVDITHTVRDGVREIVNLLQHGIIDNPYEEKYYNTNIKL
jgi:nucleoside-diphosphate-sugar epimerase